MIKRDLRTSVLFALRSETRNLRVFRKRSRPGFPDCVVASAVLGTQTLSGFGQSFDPEEAAFIAIMELAERYIFLKADAGLLFQDTFLGRRKWSIKEIQKKHPMSINWLGNTTSGFAVHTKRSLAKENAISELVERHVVLKAQATKIKPTRMTQTNNTPASIDYYVWRGPLERFVVVARYRVQVGNCFGFGCSRDLEVARKKAFFEISPRILSLQILDFTELDTISPSKVFSFHLKESSVEEFFSSKDSKIPDVDVKLNLKNIWFREFSMPLSLRRCGIVGIQAVSPMMQPLFSGEWSQVVINPMAIPTIPPAIEKQFPMIG